MLRVDSQWYRDRYEDVADVLDVEAHYATIGWRQGKDPNQYFSTNWYLLEYPDILASDLNPLEHFIEFGKNEGRFPNHFAKAAKSLSDRGLVDDEWYHKTYPDVSSEIDAATHYVQFGWLQKKNPSAQFDTRWYLSAYPDIETSGLNPFLHYVDYGALEGRFANEEEYLVAKIRSTPYFDSKWYETRYRDLPLGIDPAIHYVEHGWKEMRDPSARFSTNWYLSNNADIMSVGINPLVHFIEHGRAEGRSPKPTFLETIRAQDWWAGKSSPILSIFYATAVLCRVSIWSLMPALGVLLLAIISGAMFVSLINDFTDREEDRLSGKANRLLGRRDSEIGLLFVACAVIGLFVGAYLVVVTAFAPLCFFAMTWAVFFMYSMPPIRLKVRGVFGAIADASGAHLFPVIFAATLVISLEHRSGDLFWLVTVAVWSFCVGLRGIVTHQLGDFENDGKVGVNTLVVKRGPKDVDRLVKSTVFPLEVTALCCILATVNLPALWFTTFIYVGLEVWRSRLLFGAFLVVGQIKGLRSGIVLPVGFPFYTIFMPIGILLGSIQRHPEDALILCLHLLFFGFVPVRREWLIQVDAAIRYYYPPEKTFTRSICL